MSAKLNTVRYMQDELTQWGKWARGTESNPSQQIYQSPSLQLMRLKQTMGNYSPIQLDDDALLAVDSLVTQLKLSRPDLYQWVDFYYLKGIPIKIIAAHSAVPRYTVDKYLLAAETWLDCRLTEIVIKLK